MVYKSHFRIVSISEFLSNEKASIENCDREYESKYSGAHGFIIERSAIRSADRHGLFPSRRSWLERTASERSTSTTSSQESRGTAGSDGGIYVRVEGN